MKKLFIPYNLAKQLKDKGFDKPCLAYYSKLQKGKLIIWQTINHNGTNYLGIESSHLAPIYQQAIDWLRKKYDIHILGEVTGTSYQFRVGTKNGLFGAHNEKEILIDEDDYYKALNKAIEEALKLI